MDISERISMLRGKTPREEFSEGTGVSGQTLYKYEKKLSTPTIEFVDLLCKKFKINHRWLITGDGPMRLEEDQSVSTSQEGQSQPTEITASIPCTRCEKLENKLEKVENQRDELADENRRLLKENGLLREENATLRERQRKEQASPFDEHQKMPETRSTSCSNLELHP